MIVDVWSGDSKKHLGRGRLVGTATVYAFVMKDDTLLSSNDCETRPSDADIAEMAKDGGELVAWPDNPKIVLDSGETVYGCQVWWQPMETP